MSDLPLRSTPPAPSTAGELAFNEELLWSIQHGGVAPFPFLECPTHLSLVLRLEGPLDAEALRRAVGEVARRHAVLRSRFPEHGGRPVRVIDPPAPVPLAGGDLSALPEAERGPALGRLLREQTGAPFDLRTDPAFRARLVRLGGEAHAFAFTVHHIVFDSYSRGVLAHELAAHYAVFVEGAEPLPPPAAQYDDFVRWQRERLGGGALERLAEGWRARLGGAPEPRFPGAAEPAEGSVACAFALDADSVEAIRRLSRTHAVTPAILLLALYALFLHRAAGAGELVAGLPLSDRRRREFEALIGLFVNVMVVRASMEGSPTFPALLRRVRDGVQQAVAQQDLPYWHHVRAAALAEGRTVAAPYRVVFNFINHGGGAARPGFPGLRVESIPAGNQPPGRADLSLVVRDHGADWRGELSFRRSSFSPDEARRWTDRFRALVGEVLREPERALGEYGRDGET